MVKPQKTLDVFFKRKDSESLETTVAANIDNLIPDHQQSYKKARVEHEKFDQPLERDPGLRRQIWEYPINLQDEIRRAYIKEGSYQFILPEYPRSGLEKHSRRFQSAWFKLFSWFEYSPTKDAVFCLPCFLFSRKPSRRPGSHAFTIEGFRNWKKVNDGKRCAFLNHIGDNPCSPHNIIVQSCDGLMNQSRHIDKVMNAQTSEQVSNNRLRLKTSIDSIRWLILQGCAYRGRDESSRNRGNFIEMIKLLSTYNERVANVVLDNAPANAKYIAPSIQKEVLHILSKKVKDKIRKNIGDSKFCIIVDEARDESKREQVALVLRFIDQDGYIREHFFSLVLVNETTTITLKKKLSKVLSHFNLSINNIRGQGYDGASNMHGEWKGLQALFLNECANAYYIHCFSHRLQLALVAALRDVILVHQVFSKLNFVINIITASSKRHGELQLVHSIEINQLLDMDELESGRGANQIGTLQRAGKTRWNSHFHSICSLIKMLGATSSVLQNISDRGTTYSQRGDVDTAYKDISSFEFVFILHLMKDIMGISDILCQALQQKSQDILNAMQLVTTTKNLIQNLREKGWDILLETVKLFCERYEIEIPDMNAQYIKRRGRCHQQQDHITMEHYYRIDIFTATLDSQLYELNSRFNEKAVELLILSSKLDPKNGYKLFDVDSICKLAEKFYPQDFTEQEILHLRFQLQHYILDIPHHPHLKNMSTISELCRGLTETEKSKVYHLIDRLIRLVLTLPVSTATTERAFSAMKIVKTRLRNKMEDEFLEDCLTVYIEGKFLKLLVPIRL